MFFAGEKGFLFFVCKKLFLVCRKLRLKAEECEGKVEQILLGAPYSVTVAIQVVLIDTPPRRQQSQK